MIRKYAGMRPEELALALRGNPLIICPWEVPEWQGDHLALAFDGILYTQK